MGKSKQGGLIAVEQIDNNLADLFAASAGESKKPPTTRYTELLPAREPTESDSDAEDDDEGDDEVLSELGSEDSNAEDVENEGASADEDEQSSEASEEESEEALAELRKKERKRKRRDEHDDLESKYLSKLAADDDEEPTEKRHKSDAGEAAKGESAEADAPEEDTPMVHESLQKSEEHVDIELDKANRTVFLANVAAEAISSSKAKKQLMAHLSSPLAALDAASGPHKIESLRFRSTAFSGGGLPKRAAYITKSLMTATTTSTNAYAVYTTPLAARAAVRALNGTVVLDRHLKADSVAHPRALDSKRCVFVGNLGFVDDETVINTTADGETTTKKRTKTPADTEEGLWRVFGKQAGKVESVRVPRDPKSRVGKGFAYVQFHDANDVEAALLLDGKKFPPMLPRLLRVSRAKDPGKTALAQERKAKARLAAGGPLAGKPKSTKYQFKATPEQQSLAGRASRLLGRAGAVREQKKLKGGGDGDKKPKHRATASREGPGGGAKAIKTPEQIVFEGRRASSRDAKPKDLKLKVKGKKGAAKSKTKNRGAKRAAEWRKGGK